MQRHVPRMRSSHFEGTVDGQPRSILETHGPSHREAHLAAGDSPMGAPRFSGASGADSSDGVRTAAGTGSLLIAVCRCVAP